MIKSHQLSESVSMRVLRLSDAGALAAAYVRNREYLSHWEPVRPEEYYTESWQAVDIASRLVAHETGEGYPLGLFAGDTLVGRFNVAGIVRGPFQNAGLGYWVDSDYAGRGLASVAVQRIVEMARDELELHRIEASTLLHNAGFLDPRLDDGHVAFTNQVPSYFSLDFEPIRKIHGGGESEERVERSPVPTVR